MKKTGAELMTELVQQSGPWGIGAVVLWHFRNPVNVSFGSPPGEQERK